MSPLMAMVKDVVFKCPGRKVSIEDMYKAYTEYCAKTNAKASSMHAFQGEPILRSDKVTLGDTKRKTYVVNVSLDPKMLPGKKAIRVKGGFIV